MTSTSMTLKSHAVMLTVSFAVVVLFIMLGLRNVSPDSAIECTLVVYIVSNIL